MDGCGYRVECIKRNTNEFSELVQFVIRTYFEAFGATIEPDPDFFVAIKSENGKWLGCFGMTSAESNTLFSERYLDSPVEKMAEDALGKKIVRARIAECGSFASPELPGIGKILVAVMPWVLASFGFDYALVTVTPQVRFMFRKMNISFVELNMASIDALVEPERDSWGSYYDYKPMTAIVDIRESIFYSMKRKSSRYVISSMSIEHAQVNVGAA